MFHDHATGEHLTEIDIDFSVDSKDNNNLAVVSVSTSLNFVLDSTSVINTGILASTVNVWFFLSENFN